MRTNIFAGAFIALFLCFIASAFAQSNQPVVKNPKIADVPLPNPNVIIVTPVYGNNLACVGSPSQPGNFQHFTVSGKYLTDVVTITAPTGFEISLTSGSGYSTNNIVLTPLVAGGIVNTTTIYVRLAAGDAPGYINGSVMLASTGAPSQSVMVWGTVYMLPTINPVSSQTKKSGTATDPVSFSGSGNTFGWYNNTPSIGLVQSGTGNIPSFIAVNNGTTPVTATITVTPTNAGILYMGDLENNVLEAINTTTRAVVNIPTGNNPSGVATSLDGTRAYVTNFNNGQPGSVSVINTSTNSIIKTIQVGTAPFSIAVTPDGKWVYVADVDSVSVINATTNTLYKSIGIETRNNNGLVLSSDGSLLYVSTSQNDRTDSLSIFSTATNTELYRIPLPNDTQHFGDIMISPDGSKLYGNNYYSDTIKVIDIAATIKTDKIKIIKSFIVNTVPTSITMSPDGSRIYAANDGSNTVTVIDAINYSVITTFPTAYPIPDGMTVSPDGNYLYLINSNNNNISVIDTKTNTITNSYSGGPPMFSWTAGSFSVPATGCPGMPATFTITVLPKNAIPTFIVSPASGTISACSGVPSASPNLQQFTVSGNNLTDAVTATAPPEFEVSLTPNGGYGSNVTLNQSEGTLPLTTVYVRASAINAPGPINGKNIVVSFPGLPDQSVAVSAYVNISPTVNSVANQTKANGAATDAVNFTGTGNAKFDWTNDTPGIGLPASGSGNIASFTAINNGNVPVIASITVTPTNTTSCSGAPVTFTITVMPTVTLTETGALSPLSAVYGSNSASETFTVSGTNISSGILVKAPTGFEVSIDGVTYSTTATINGSGDVSAVVYIRLASTNLPDSYSGTITVSTNYAPDVTFEMPGSTVNPAPLTITADNKSKLYGADNPDLTVTYTGFVNNDGPAQLMALPNISTTATTLSPFGQYPIIVSGAVSPNYIFTYIPGVFTIKPILSMATIPNAFTPNGDGINDTWEINGLQYYTQCTVNIFNRWGQKLYSSIRYPTPWNGEYNGRVLPPATYYYIIDLKNGQAVITGPVTIIR